MKTSLNLTLARPQSSFAGMAALCREAQPSRHGYGLGGDNERKVGG